MPRLHTEKKHTALITGASTGIGYELARLLAAEGHDVILVARNRTRLAQVAKELRKFGKSEITVMPADLSRPGSAAKLFAAIKKARIRVDWLFNNAGFGNSGPFHKNDLKSESELIQLNIATLAELCHLFAREMVTRKSGGILNVASTAAFQPGPLMSNYYASKAYVLHFTEGLAEELADYNIQVTALCPGATRTEFFKRAEIERSNLVKGKLARIMSAAEVALSGYNGFKSGKVVVIPGIMNKILAFSVRITPRFLIRKITMLLNSNR